MARVAMKSNRKELVLVIAVTGLTILCIALLVTLLTKVLDYRSKKVSHCASKECVVTAAAFIQSIDEAEDPCKDFYSYVCNGYVKTASPLNDHFQERGKLINLRVKELLESNLDDGQPNAVKKLRAAYDACRNTTRIKAKWPKQFKIYVDGVLGGWPLAIGDSWSPPSKFPLENLLAKLQREGLSGILFATIVNPNPRNPSENRIKLDEATASTNDFEGCGKRRKRAATDDAKNVKIVVNIARILGSNDTARAKNEGEIMLHLESELDEITTSTEDTSNLSYVFKNLTIKELQRLTNYTFNWLEYFKNTFDGYAQIDENEEIIVADLPYLEEVTRTLRKYDARVLFNLALWKAFKTLIEFIPLSNSWTKCTKHASNMFPFALWRLYAENDVNDETLDSAREFVDNLRHSYDEAIRSSDWLDSETKEKAIRKLGSIEWAIGYPSWANDDDALNAYYEKILITPDHFVNSVTTMQFSAERTLKKLRRPVDRKEWPDELDVLTANAFNMLNVNKIYIPASMLHHPFYAADRLKALNYGSFGMLIAHEIGHAFDVEGSQLDEKGALRDWWNKSSHEEYARRSRCFEDQYNEYCFPEEESEDNDNTCVDGELTLAENVPDNAGLLCAHAAYTNWVKKHGVEKKLPGMEKYTADQMFFISFGYMWCENIDARQWTDNFADEDHSPGRFRVNGPLSNAPAFSRAFNCPEGPMYRGKNECSLW